jgi:hypothetical protein
MRSSLVADACAVACFSQMSSRKVNIRRGCLANRISELTCVFNLTAESKSDATETKSESAGSAGAPLAFALSSLIAFVRRMFALACFLAPVAASLRRLVLSLQYISPSSVCSSSAGGFALVRAGSIAAAAAGEETKAGVKIAEQKAHVTVHTGNWSGTAFVRILESCLRCCVSGAALLLASVPSFRL